MRAGNETLTFTQIADKAMVKVFLKAGTSFIGTLRQSAGWPWVSVEGQEPFSLAYVSPTFAEVEAIEVVADKPSKEERRRGNTGQLPTRGRQRDRTMKKLSGSSQRW